MCEGNLKKSKTEFFNQLKSAICLVGGGGRGVEDEPSWETMEISEIYNILHLNGIRLGFTINPQKLEGKFFK